MRVALVDPLAYTPPYDDALAAALAERGQDVRLLTGPFLHGEVPAPHGYAREEIFLPLSRRIFRDAPRSPLRLPLKAIEYWPSSVRLRRRLRALDPDIVHVQWLPRPELDMHWLRRIVQPLVLTAHDVVPRRPRARNVWPRVLEVASCVIVHSDSAVEKLVGFGADRARVVRIRHPVFAGETLGPAQGRTLLFFGLIRDYKGLDVLVRSLTDVPDTRLVVAGDPVDAVAPVQELARELGVDGRIEWRLRFIEEREIRDLMAEAAIVVLPYTRLDSSGVLATAIGYRRAVVVTDVGSLGEIVREFGAGEVVPPGDPHALAEAITRSLEPAALTAATSGAEAAARALTWEAAAEQHERVYEAVRR
jgi:glycosyltransferase involved in cell wall biosynthesis